MTEKKKRTIRNITNKRFRSSKMLTENQISQIHALHSKGKSVRKIAEWLGMSRNTVTKYLENPSAVHKKRVKSLDSHRKIVRELFFKCEGNCVVVARELKEKHGLEVCPRTLRAYCNQFRKDLTPEDVFIRYETAPGQQMQIDFGMKKLIINDEPVDVHFFVSILSYSRRIFVKAYITENQKNWLDGIESSFRYFDGVPLCILSDNTRCLVKSHKPNQPVEFTRRYNNFCDYWHVNPIASAPYHPQSKGKCERAVRYVKENALVGKTFKNLAELNQWLEKWCRVYSDKRELKNVFEGLKTPRERFWTEKANLMECKLRIVSLREETRRVDKTGLIRIDNNFYKLPIEHANTDVQVLMDDETITVTGKNKVIAELDKVRSVYIPKPQKNVSNDVTEHSVIEDVYHANPLQRPLKAYQDAVEGS